MADLDIHDAELEKWETFSDELRTAITKQWDASCGSALQSLEANVEALQLAATELLPETQQILSENLDEVESAFAQSTETLTECFERYANAAAELAEVFVEQFPAAVESSQERLRNATDQSEEKLHVNFGDHLTGIAHEQLGRVHESAMTVQSRLNEELLLLAGEVGELKSLLLERFKTLQAEWMADIDETKTEFENFKSQVEELGASVTTLTGAIDDAMQTTGVGMNAAADVLTEVVQILEDVT